MIEMLGEETDEAFLSEVMTQAIDVSDLAK